MVFSVCFTCSLMLLWDSGQWKAWVLHFIAHRSYCSQSCGDRRNKLWSSSRQDEIWSNPSGENLCEVFSEDTSNERSNSEMFFQLSFSIFDLVFYYLPSWLRLTFYQWQINSPVLEWCPQQCLLITEIWVLGSSGPPCAALLSESKNVLKHKRSITKRGAL